jgi:hypothetical protein
MFVHGQIPMENHLSSHQSNDRPQKGYLSPQDRRFKWPLERPFKRKWPHFWLGRFSGHYTPDFWTGNVLGPSLRRWSIGVFVRYLASGVIPSPTAWSSISVHSSVLNQRRDYACSTSYSIFPQLSPIENKKLINYQLQNPWFQWLQTVPQSSSRFGYEPRY